VYIGALELFIVSFGLTYYLATAGVGLAVMLRSGWRGRHARRGSARPARAAVRHRHSRRGVMRGRIAAGCAGPFRGGLRRLATAEQAPPRASVVVEPEDLVTYFLVPCLNEELVVARTVRALLADHRARVIVIDDASDDATGELAAAVDRDRVIVVRRELPDARLGKGPALNCGFDAVLHDAAVHRIAASRIVIGVMDADGELSPRALDEVLPLFCDARVGGVQLPVRIRNTGSLLTTLQDLEFWGVAAIGQIGRNATGTVSLGGNGQFTRLSALLGLGRSPWRPRLTEDLDLGLALAAAGWRLVSTPRAHVTQQGVPRLRGLIRQRTRWYQGHMQASEWLRTLWSSPNVSHLGMLEITLYVVIPWVLVLPWSILFNYNLFVLVSWLLGWAAAPPIGSDLTEQITSICAWYLLSFMPIWSAGYMYYRQRRGKLIRSLLVGHLLIAANYVTYVACWSALFRLITGTRGWQKTKRVDEDRSALPAAQLHELLVGAGRR